MTADIDQSVAEIEETYGIDLTDPTPPVPASLQAAQTLIETLWSVSRLLVSRGSAAEGEQKTRESLKQLLGSEDPASVQQGLVLLRAIDDPLLWADFAEGLTSDLTIGGMIKGWVQPSHQLNVARFVALHTGLLEGVTELNVTAAVHELGGHSLGGPHARLGTHGAWLVGWHVGHGRAGHWGPGVNVSLVVVEKTGLIKVDWKLV